MEKETQTPANIPPNGFYYHNKHDPEKGIYDYSYEVIGLAMHTEERGYLVLYRPLYENDFLAPANYSARPYEMFIETIEKNGAMIPRFKKIEDEEVIEKLKEARERMYKD